MWFVIPLGRFFVCTEHFGNALRDSSDSIGWKMAYGEFFGKIPRESNNSLGGNC